MVIIVEQIVLGNDAMSLFGERSQTEVDIVDVERDRSTPTAVVKQRIGVVNVELGLQQRKADFDVRLRVVGELDADEIGFKGRELRELEDLASPLVVVEDQTGD